MQRINFDINQTASEIINNLKKIEWVKDIYKETVRHCLLEKHTLLVMLQYEKYFLNVNLPIEKIIFRVLLALHDLGKPSAFKEGNISLQYQHTLQIIDRLRPQMLMSELEIDLCKSVVNGDPIGQYLQKKIDLDTAVSQIKETAAATFLGTQDFFKLLTIYYQCDAGSYTKDAGGLKFLEYVFEYKDGVKEFNEQLQRLRFSKNYEERFGNLENKINE